MDTNNMLYIKIFPSDEINGTKNAFFFLSRASTHHSFTFNLRFLYELKHKVRFCKTVCGIFHFRFRFVFIEVLHSFAPRLIFKLQQEVLKFNDICVGWSSPKTDLMTNFSTSESRTPVFLSSNI